MPFYKVVQKHGVHRGMTYQRGRNVDALPFMPWGDCKPGGLYFASTDILAFLEFGPNLWTVTLPAGTMVYKNPGSPVKYKAHTIILGKKEKITAGVIKRLIEEGANPRVDGFFPLHWACWYQKLNVVKVLIPYCTRREINRALCRAAERGNFSIVKTLLPHADPKSNGSEALRAAAGGGTKSFYKVLKLLLPVSNPNAYACEALRSAVRHGDLKAVRLLFPVSNVRRSKDRIRWEAEQWGTPESMRLIHKLMEKMDSKENKRK
jgi:hypothetical protein